MKWSLRLKNNLTGMEFKNLNWMFTIFEGKNHYDSYMTALFWGLEIVNREP